MNEQLEIIGENLNLQLMPSPRADALLVSLLREFEQWRPPPRRRNDEFERAIKHTLHVITANLLRQSLQRPAGYLFVVGRPDWYSRNRFWLGAEFTHTSVNLVVRFLTAHKYVIFVKGRASLAVSFRRTNAIQATEKLRLQFHDLRLSVVDCTSSPAFYPVRLKGSKDANGRKPHLEFRESTETLRMTQNIRAVNQKLLSHWADIQLTGENMKQLGRRLEERQDANASSVYIDLTRRTVYRVFNNGRFDEGGRFYGGWWQSIPKAWRPYITIDGKRTVEVDYSAMHPTILYQWEDLEIPEDPYDIGIGSRHLVKASFNALLNAEGTNLRQMKGFDEKDVGVTWQDFLSALRSHYHKFEQYFGTGIGLKLQKIDSDIAELVMLEFVDKEVPLLPVHDSFLCHHALEEELRQAMERRFEEVVGRTINMKSKELNSDQRRMMQDTSSNSHAQLLETGLTEVEALIASDQAYGAYDKRLDDWFSRRSDIETTEQGREVSSGPLPLLIYGTS